MFHLFYIYGAPSIIKVFKYGWGKLQKKCLEEAIPSLLYWAPMFTFSQSPDLVIVCFYVLKQHAFT